MAGARVCPGAFFGNRLPADKRARERAARRDYGDKHVFQATRLVEGQRSAGRRDASTNSPPPIQDTSGNADFTCNLQDLSTPEVTSSP